jgi:hypothetical protein
VLPAAFIFVTNPSLPCSCGWKALTMGKFCEDVMPPTYAFPAESTPIPYARSVLEPPR